MMVKKTKIVNVNLILVKFFINATQQPLNLGKDFDCELNYG